MTDRENSFVRICEAHDDLVAACEIGLQYIEAVCFNTPNAKKRKNYADAARIIRDALAKANGHSQGSEATRHHQD